jgi:hypothetical protein
VLCHERVIRVVEEYSMLYWIGAYALVILAVMLPFAFLYIVVALLWLGTKALHLMIRRLTGVPATPTDVSKQRWHVTHRGIVSH